MLLREIFIGGARAPPAPPHATALLSAPLKPFTVATLHYQLVDNTKLPTADM